ncbi:NAD(P)H-dependent oxidoreductase [Frankia sp. CNm7]|uniref:FMN dependent NADH:quinone oxidoreductase n=1 Tax=Frankia nepalensis TaxID=1836974 RepID=A0A937RGH6_9ACTN|nr:NAD(P)H-dependent oxidoreductase [Frankia nepalensis]MBL7495897.1 NAD(P)H-dependent oxidoreductase [Frankia nepalensis]MBL7510376.1 NAD(P)H-dependent oxidoreductase [Frankia nepalensis]MBL7524170.1 NAD(P)H-dependent oxidoreductase [Frankia nepalensis]MBL7629975.1 NAD(P)H-dependent oxidoreductase [Frankia nepalensis]
MTHLLHLDSSFTGDMSVSRAVAREYVAAWQEANADGVVTYRDLAAAPPAHLDWTGVSAGMTPEDQRSPEQTEAVKAREAYIGEVAAADEVLVTAPMYNWSVPTQLKSWFDWLIVPGVTVADANTPGLLGGKKVTVVTTQGGSYGPGTPKEGWDHVSPYVAHMLEALGAGDVEFVNVEMTLSTRNPALAEFVDLFHASRAAAAESVKIRATA